MHNENEDNTIQHTAVTDEDRVLLEHGIIPDELSPEERKDLLNDLNADGNSADNDERSGVQPSDENDGTNPA